MPVTMSAREFRKWLAKDSEAEARAFDASHCTRCGRRFGRVIYDGGAGRRLCIKCGRDEGASPVRGEDRTTSAKPTEDQ